MPREYVFWSSNYFNCRFVFLPLVVLPGYFAALCGVIWAFGVICFLATNAKLVLYPVVRSEQTWKDAMVQG